jgi:hypothetical protein
VNASKDEIRAIAEHDPGRIQEIRELESEVTELRKTRNAEHRAIHGDTVICPECDGVDADACEECMGTGVIPAKRYKHDRATFFLGNSILKYSPPIDEVIGWSRTSRGGRQLPLLAEPPVGGCMRWGFCDPPAKDDE